MLRKRDVAGRNAVDETIYYQDNEGVAVTSHRVRLAEKVHSLAELRYAAAVQQGQGWRVGRVRVPTGLVVVGLYMAGSFLSAAILGILFPGLNSLLGILLLVTAGSLAGWLFTVYLRRSGHYKYVLYLMLSQRNDNSFVSPDEVYVKELAKVINRAISERNRILATTKQGPSRTRIGPAGFGQDR
ncbi:MAG: DUF6232 family protein [Chloroflexota bacterium]